MSECKAEKNKKNCNCTYPCSRKGMCCDCLSYHKARDELPACFFSSDAESTYDRSIDAFIKEYQRR